MASFVTFKAMLGRHKHGAFMLATIALVLLLGLSAYYKQASIPDAEISVRSKKPAEFYDSVSTNKDLSNRIKTLVKSLEYPDKVAEDFTRMVMDWKDEKNRSILLRWKVELSNAHKEYQERKITRNQVVKIEESILREFFEIIRMQFSDNNFSFELSDIIENRQVNCLSFSQLMYITCNAVGLLVRPIDVLDPLISSEDGTRQCHMACIVDLFDGRLVMADVLLLFEIPSRAFKLEDHFLKVGHYWELKDKDNPLKIHKRIRLLDGKGLLASIYNSRGAVYLSGEYDRAILEYNKAIENDPGNALAYFNRGVTYYDKDEYDRAILDYTKAIEIDLRFPEAYYNRGIIYANKGEYDQAIQDYTKAIEINPKYTSAYINRGGIYEDKGEYDHAIQDYTKIIEINPKITGAYYNRGLTYVNKDEFDRAILDFTKAIEINPKYADAYYNRGLTYVNKDEFDQAILDFTKAIEINPKYADSYNNRGRAYYERDEYVRAILDFKKAIEIDPNYALAYLNRAEVYAELGKSKEAKKDLLKALKLDPELREHVKEISEQYELDLKLD